MRLAMFVTCISLLALAGCTRGGCSSCGLRGTSVRPTPRPIAARPAAPARGPRLAAASSARLSSPRAVRSSPVAVRSSPVAVRSSPVAVRPAVQPRAVSTPRASVAPRATVRTAPIPLPVAAAKSPVKPSVVSEVPSTRACPGGVCGIPPSYEDCCPNGVCGIPPESAFELGSDRCGIPAPRN